MKYYKLSILIVTLLVIFTLGITNFYKFDTFGFTNQGKIYTYYQTQVRMPKSAHHISEFSSASGFPADGAEVLMFKVSREDLDAILGSSVFGKTDQWQKGPYPDGCLGGFLQPCDKLQNLGTSTDHRRLDNSQDLFYAKKYSETDGLVVFILDTNTLQVLVYKYTT